MPQIKRLFSDGILSLTNMLANKRNAHITNRMMSSRVDWEELRAIYRTGVGSKIIRLKTGIALNDTLQFDSADDKEFYTQRLQKFVKKAAKFQLAFGRALLVIHEPGGDLSQPIGTINDWKRVRYHVFSGDMVFIQSVNLDLSSPNYFEPTRYSVRGFTIHPSRCIDFKYVEPTELDAPEYFYGGISEFELIRNELVSDQVVQRAIPAILEKSSSIFYKVKGFKELLADKQESQLVTYFTSLENLRSIYGAGIIDSEDAIESISQALTNLAESDLSSLRRLAMVTGLPLSWLVGEAARGLNSTGDGERQVLKHTIESHQSDYLLEPINRLMVLHGRGPVEFTDGLLETDVDRMDMQTKAIDNAVKLWQMGEDHTAYLEYHDVIQKDDFDAFFEIEEETAEVLPGEEQQTLEQLLGLENG